MRAKSDNSGGRPHRFSRNAETEDISGQKSSDAKSKTGKLKSEDINEPGQLYSEIEFALARIRSLLHELSFIDYQLTKEFSLTVMDMIGATLKSFDHTMEVKH